MAIDSQSRIAMRTIIGMTASRAAAPAVTLCGVRFLALQVSSTAGRRMLDDHGGLPPGYLQGDTPPRRLRGCSRRRRAATAPAPAPRSRARTTPPADAAGGTNAATMTIPVGTTAAVAVLARRWLMITDESARARRDCWPEPVGPGWAPGAGGRQPVGWPMHRGNGRGVA